MAKNVATGSDCYRPGERSNDIEQYEFPYWYGAHSYDKEFTLRTVFFNPETIIFYTVRGLFCGYSFR